MNEFLKTKRLYILPPRLEDLSNQLLLQTDPDVMRFIGKGYPRTTIEVEQGLKLAVEHQTKHGFSLGSVFELQTNQFVGRAGLIYLGYDDTQAEIEVGYALLPSAWGKGYATELAQALVEWGFEHLPIDKLVGVTHPANRASQHVLEKIGMCYTKMTTYHDFQVTQYEISRCALKLQPTLGANKK